VEIVRPLPGEQIQTQKALIHKHIEALLFVITEIIQKYLYDLNYLVCVFQFPCIYQIMSFWGS
jgi:hypothetical protein